MSAEQKPTQDELEELAALALAMALALNDGEYGDAVVIAAVTGRVAKPILDGPVPAWAKAARARCAAKLSGAPS